MLPLKSEEFSPDSGKAGATKLDMSALLLRKDAFDVHEHSVYETCDLTFGDGETVISLAELLAINASVGTDHGLKDYGITVREEGDLEIVNERKTKYHHHGCTVNLNLANMENNKTPAAKVGTASVTGISMHLLVYLCMLCVMMQPSEASSHQTCPGQPLPPDCMNIFEERDCPYTDFSLSEYQAMNDSCCKSYPGNDFHCQENYKFSGETYFLAACVQTVALGDGQHGSIVCVGGEAPHFGNVSNNSLHAARPSWQVRYMYDDNEKSLCNGDGEALLCAGSGSYDNLCFCKAGFQASPQDLCTDGHTRKVGCSCNHVTTSCPEGTHGETFFHNFTAGDPCSNKPADLAYENQCVPDPEPGDSSNNTTYLKTTSGPERITISPPTSRDPSSRGSGETDPTGDGESGTGNGEETSIVRQVLIPLLCLVFILLGFACVFCLFWAYILKKPVAFWKGRCRLRDGFRKLRSSVYYRVSTRSNAEIDVPV
jgi:hypothetical protein